MVRQIWNRKPSTIFQRMFGNKKMSMPLLVFTTILFWAVSTGCFLFLLSRNVFNITSIQNALTKPKFVTGAALKKINPKKSLFFHRDFNPEWVNQAPFFIYIDDVTKRFWDHESWLHMHYIFQILEKLPNRVRTMDKAKVIIPKVDFERLDMWPDFFEYEQGNAVNLEFKEGHTGPLVGWLDRFSVQVSSLFPDATVLYLMSPLDHCYDFCRRHGNVAIASVNLLNELEKESRDGPKSQLIAFPLPKLTAHETEGSSRKAILKKINRICKLARKQGFYTSNILASFQGRDRTYNAYNDVLGVNHMKKLRSTLMHFLHVPKKRMYFVVPELSGDDVDGHTFDYWMNRSLFGLVPGGDGPYSFRFLEVIERGAIPVVISNGWTLPFESVVDWGKYIVRMDEFYPWNTSVDRFVQRLEKIEMNGTDVCVRLKGLYHVYNKYFSTMERQLFTLFKHYFLV